MDKLLLINRSAFPAGPIWLGTEFMLGGDNYQVVNYAGNYQDGVFNKIIASPAPAKHPEVLKLLPTISPSYVLPKLDKRDLDLIFLTKEEAIRYWLGLGKYQVTIIKYVKDDLYRIPHSTPCNSEIDWQFDYVTFTQSMGLLAGDVAELLQQENYKYDR